MRRNNLQLQLYALACEQLIGVLPSYAVIESIEDGRRGETPITQACVATAAATVQEVMRA